MIPALSPVGGPTTPPFSPDDISGLALWLDASFTSSVHLSGSDVTQWDDRSGNARNVTAGVGTRPTYTATQNGLNVISFNGSNQRFYSSSAALLRNVAGWTVFWVGMTTTPTVAMANVYVNCGAPAARMSTGTRVTTGYLFGGGRRQNGDSFANIEDTVAISSSTYYYVTIIGDFTNTDGFLYRNGSLHVTNNSWSTTGNTDNDLGDVSIGAAGDSGSSSAFWSGNMAEILIYNSALGTTDRQSVEAYLASKWGL